MSQSPTRARNRVMGDGLLELIPEVLLPCQWLVAPAEVSWVRRLMLGVLDEAFRNLRADTISGRDAHAWLHSTESESPMSALIICETIGIDIGELRTKGDLKWAKRIRLNGDNPPPLPRVMRRVSHSRSRKISA